MQATLPSEDEDYLTNAKRRTYIGFYQNFVRTIDNEQ
jgi:hypothetical protein